MKNILTVFTGGTIGSTVANNTINTDKQNSYKLLELFTRAYPKAEQITFKNLEPFQILSENMHPSVWTALIKTIENESIDTMDGIIVTHGSDTLAYTAAALSLYFRHLQIPLLLVASDYPLEDTRANGLANFNCAVEFILQHNQAGVYVPYQNPNQIMQVHLGCRLTSSLQLTGEFYSARLESYLEFSGNEFKVLKPVSDKPSEHDPQKINPVFSERVLMIRPYPGLDYSRINLEGLDAVCHDLYHSGTACTSMQWGINHSLIALLKHCKNQQVKVYLAPSIQSESAYLSTRELLDNGAAMIWNMSLESAYVKLLLAYGNFDKEQKIMDFINSDIAGEHV